MQISDCGTPYLWPPHKRDIYKYKQCKYYTKQTGQVQMQIKYKYYTNNSGQMQI